MSRYYHGRFQPRNPKKYKGNPSEIVYRSSWELQAMNYFDLREEVIQWSSEEIIVPYKCVFTGKWRRYFPDFVITVVDKNNVKATHMIEVKPYKETMEPRPGTRKTKRYLKEVQTWGINSTKWKYAREYCADRKWHFTIITEKDLFAGNKRKSV